MNTAQEIANGEAFIATLPSVKQHQLVGSAMYLGDQAKDVDFALLVDVSPPQPVHIYQGELFEKDFELCTGEDGYPEGTSEWFAMRRGNLNLIVMRDADRFAKYVAAMEVCKLLRVPDRDTRIAVCRIVRDGMTADEVKL